MPRKLPTPWIYLAIALAITTVASAQDGAYQPGGGYPVPYYGNGGYGYNYGAGSTPAGSYLSGMAQSIRAQGEYNLMTAQSAIPLEQAKKMEIENRVAWTNAYFEMRRINQAYTHPKKPKPSDESWVRAAHTVVPARLSPTSLDPITGKISWPDALQGAEYKPQRDALDALFSHRAQAHGAIGDTNHAKIKTQVTAALETLKSHIRELDTQTYLDARRFLNNLGHESDYPVTASPPKAMPMS